MSFPEGKELPLTDAVASTAADGAMVIFGLGPAADDRVSQRQGSAAPVGRSAGGGVLAEEFGATASGSGRCVATQAGGTTTISGLASRTGVAHDMKAFTERIEPQAMRTALPASRPFVR